MLKIRLMGTKNDIKWFEKILKRQPTSLGFTEPDKLEVTLANVMEKVINDEEIEPGYGIFTHGEGIDLMPGNIELSGLEVSLVNVMRREIMMRSYVEMVNEQYDYIQIDCMPSLGMITINGVSI